MLKNKLVYMAGAYSSHYHFWLFNRIQVLFNILKARKAAKQLWTAGIYAICPHSNSGFMDSCAPYWVFLQGDLEMLKRCAAVLVLDNYHNSEGAKIEIGTAENRNIPVFYDIKKLVEA